MWQHRRSQGVLWRDDPPKFLKYIVILCFERRYPKQNSFIRLKSNILAPLKILPLQIIGLATLVCGNSGCVLIQPHTCACNMCIKRDSSLIGSSGGLIKTAQTTLCLYGPHRMAYERGVQEVHRTRAQQVLGPGVMKVRTLNFSANKPKIDDRFLQLQR